MDRLDNSNKTGQIVDQIFEEIGLTDKSERDISTSTDFTKSPTFSVVPKKQHSNEELCDTMPSLNNFTLVDHQIVIEDNISDLEQRSAMIMPTPLALAPIQLGQGFPGKLRNSSLVMEPLIPRLSVEERKRKIQRYKKKRNERNFFKKTKISEQG